MFRYLLPLMVFIGIVILFVAGLQRDPGIVPSPFIGKPVPVFELAELGSPDTLLGSDDMRGGVSLLNIWASWCLPCRHEHPFLLELADSSEVRIYGLNYKDQQQDALDWLEELGDPYHKIFFDAEGSAAIDLGAYGVPETFVLDSNNIIHYKHIGPINRQTMDEIILPLIKKLRDTQS